MRDRGPGEGRDAYRQGNSRKTVIKLRSGEQKERGLLSVAVEKRLGLASKRYRLRDSSQRTTNLLTRMPKSVIWMLGAERYLPPLLPNRFVWGTFFRHVCRPLEKCREQWTGWSAKEREGEKDW